jgi:hypothetical protein
MAPLAARMRNAAPAKRCARERSLRSRSEAPIALVLCRKNLSEEDTTLLRLPDALGAFRAAEFEWVDANLIRLFAVFIMTST